MQLIKRVSCNKLSCIYRAGGDRLENGTRFRTGTETETQNENKIVCKQLRDKDELLSTVSILCYWYWYWYWGCRRRCVSAKSERRATGSKRKGIPVFRISTDI